MSDAVERRARRSAADLRARAVRLLAQADALDPAGAAWATADARALLRERIDDGHLRPDETAAVEALIASEQGARTPGAPPALTLTGTVAHWYTDYSDPETGRCICCPGGRHRFGARLTLDPECEDRRMPEHLRDWVSAVNTVIYEHGMDGARLRITVGVVAPAPDGPPPDSATA